MRGSAFKADFPFVFFAGCISALFAVTAVITLATTKLRREIQTEQPPDFWMLIFGKYYLLLLLPILFIFASGTAQLKNQ